MDRAGSVTDAEAIRLQLERILASRVFFPAQRSQAFLRYVVEKSLAGLTPKEYEIAIDVFERNDQYDPTVDATVRVEAGRLRNRLREYYDSEGKNDPILIEIPKGGYSPVYRQTGFETDQHSPVSATDRATTKAAPHTSGPGTDQGSQPRPASPPESTPDPPQRNRATHRILVWGSLLASICLVGAVSIWLVARSQRTRAPLTSLAVLPLQNLSGDPAEDYFATGMTDELTTELARIHGLRVVSRTSSQLASRSQHSLSQIAEMLKVDAVVEGSVLRSGNKVRITAQLIDARNDKHLWAQSFEGDANDILSLQDTVADEIAAQTRVALTSSDRTRSNTPHSIRPEAHDDYLRGLYFIERRDGERAAQHFQSALNLEPTYAAAWSGLAQAMVTEFAAGNIRADDILPPAVRAAKRAIELDPDSGEGYIALGMIEFSYSEDWAAAERDLRKGISLNPGNPLGYVYLSIFLTSMKRSDEAVAAAQRAIEVDPLGFFSNRALGQALYYDRRYDESLAALHRALELAPDRAAFVEGWTSAIAETQGHYADAVNLELQGLAQVVSNDELTALRRAFATGGWKGYQQTMIHFLLPHSTENCTSGDLAMRYLRLSQVPEAFRWFQKEAEEHCVFAFQLASDPRLDPFRNAPEYRALQDRLKLPR